MSTMGSPGRRPCVGPITPTVPTTSPSTLYGEVTTLTSSGALTPDSPPMKICTPWPRSERGRGSG